MTPSPLTVLKFGGSSVGSPEALRRTAAIVQEELPRGGLVVVSALKGTTDRLLESARAAGRGDVQGAREVVAKILQHHRDTASALDLLESVEPAWEPLFQRLNTLLEGMALFGESTARSRDAVLALGETLSANLVSLLLAQAGLPASFRDVRDVLRTDGRHGAARPQLTATRRAAAAWASDLQAGCLFVTQGFIAQGPDGATTTLGRGGSDTSATLLGEALKAAEVQIWTDVDGVLSADPSLVREARPLKRLSQAEAVSLSGFGAKVLHADSLAPANRGGFRLLVANTLKPGASRTEVLPQRQAEGEGPVSVAYKEGLTVLRWPAQANVAEVLQAMQDLEEAGAVRFGFLSGPEGHVLALRPEGASASVVAGLEEEGAAVESGWAVVALVGEGLRSSLRSSLEALADLQVDLGGVLSSGGVSLAFLLREEGLSNVIPALHARCVQRLEAAV